ncbi:MAG: hypothetical protein HWN68_17285 [Desulfobacterales bacterium]|nr:hypothetical protein [Desulfobacterales bacterium]
MSKEPWKKDLRELAETVHNELTQIRKEIGEKSSSLQHDSSNRERRSGEMPLYKCKGKDCGYATDDLSDFVVHTVKENLPKPQTETAPRTKRHETVKDYLNCPECFPKFEKEFLARGYRKPEEKKKETEQKGLF